MAVRIRVPKLHHSVTDPNWPQPSAELILESTSSGFLVNRVTTTQRDAIPSPVNGLLVFNTTTNKFNAWDGASWQPIAGESGGGGVSPNIFKGTNYTAVAGDRVGADTTGGSWTLTLPASPNDGDTVWVEDVTHSWPTNPLTIARNGHTIDNVDDDLLMDGSFRVCFVFLSGQWLTREYVALFPHV